jgi:glycosyltransferase involved in cell wall biosynthesis
MLIWWGQKGGMAPLVAALAQAALARADLEVSFSLSQASAALPELGALGEALAGRIDLVPAIRNGVDALRPDRLLAARRAFATSLETRRPDAAVVLMPHVWTPLTTDLFRRARAPWACVVHDAIAHPGDPTARVLGWINSAAASADRVVTLSRFVADQPGVRRLAAPREPVVLFHPVMTPARAQQRTHAPDGALRVLFFGRLFAYRGLALTVEAIERARAGGHDVRLGVFGAGDIEALRPRLAAIGAEVENRWIEEEETAAIVGRYDVMMLSHVEASQSGAAALALGAGMPCIVTPVGALPEQTGFGRAGLVAHAATGEAVGAALIALAGDPARVASLAAGAAALAGEVSAGAFLEALAGTLVARAAHPPT